MRLISKIVTVAPVAIAWLCLGVFWPLHLITGQILILDRYLFNPDSLEGRATFSEWKALTPPEGDWAFRRFGEMDYGVFHARFAQVKTATDDEIWFDRNFKVPGERLITVVAPRSWLGLAMSVLTLALASIVWVFLMRRMTRRFV